MRTETVSTDALFETSLLEDGVQGVIGKATSRIDGPLKVSGTATYSAEYDIAGAAHGYLVLATVARATVTSLDDADARKVPGVLDIFTSEKFLPHTNQPGQTEEPKAPNKHVLYAGQPIALVVAETFEAARDAAHRLRPVYAELPATTGFDAGTAEKPKDSQIAAHASQGDIEKAMGDAAVTLDFTYTTPSQNSVAMEPHTTIAEWKGDELTLHCSMQMLKTDRQQLAKALGIDKEKIRLISPYVGGGFGSKLFASPEMVACSLAAKELGRPIKTVMTRQQVFECTVRRSNTQQRIRLGATAEGKLLAIGHDSLSSNLPGEGFFEPCGIATHFLYAGQHRHINHDVVHLNWTLAGSMRAPGEGAGMLALECAMDEMAEKLDLDPIAFRKLNEPKRDPEKDIPYSTRQLVRCMDEGAERFGWARRTAPAQRREGEWFVGIGMAAAARANRMMQAKARVTLKPDGTALVETDMTDIGTGTYTILAQIAGEMLGLPIEMVDVHLGDTNLPEAAGSGGSFGASSSGSAVYVACQAIREALCEKMSCEADDLTLKDGRAIAGNRAVDLGTLAGDGLAAEGEIKPGKNDEVYSQGSYGAHFAEVAVNAVTGEVRVRRMLGVFAAGRILNLKTARSQCIGGMTFGIGAALEEALEHDPRTGRLVNHDLAEYHVPVNADVPQIEVAFVDERDTAANPLQSKGIGELGISGAGAAIANAVYNACGVRVRDYPLTLDKILGGLPPV